ncbi:MAG: hypothetical protein L0Z47_02150 [Actinobacteria bacterium]|nr:hypothetical protein [Actinomycetota bacterium]
MRKVIGLVLVTTGGLVLYLLTDAGEAPNATPPLAVPTTASTFHATTSTSAIVDPGRSIDRGPARSIIRAALPDGTEFTVDISLVLEEAPISLWAGPIVMDIDGEPSVVGATQLSFTPYEGTTFDDGLYRTSAGGYFLQIDFYDHVLAALGPDAAAVIRDSITGEVRSSYPVVVLEEPFYWGDDDQFALQMEVDFGLFEVRRGCGDQAVACNETRAVQVIPAESARFPAPEWPDDTFVAIHSFAPRPEDDPNYLDPGPLSPRYAADVIWTGEEMIVWGGADQGVRPFLVDGAILDGDTGAWRLLPESQIRLGRNTRAVWRDDRLIVVSSDAVVAYDPANDSWSELGPGVALGRSPDHIVAAEDSIYVWSNQIHVFDIDSGSWSTLPDPPFPVGGEDWQRAIRSFNGHLLAVGTTGFCDDTSLAYWSEGEWWIVRAEVEACPRQTATSGDLLLFWSENFATYVRWVEGGPLNSVIVDSHGMGGTEGAAGGLDFGDGRILIPQYGEGAIFDRSGWTRVELPGWGTEWDMVWTGEEVLMWGVPLCCIEDGATVDAWKWTPPPP